MTLRTECVAPGLFVVIDKIPPRGYFETSPLFPGEPPVKKGVEPGA